MLVTKTEFLHSWWDISSEKYLLSYLTQKKVNHTEQHFERNTKNVHFTTVNKSHNILHC